MTVSATERAQDYRLSVEGLPGLMLTSQPTVKVEAADALWVPLQMQLPYNGAAPGSHPVTLTIASDVGTVHEKTVFLVPR